jgi:acylphosphatase
MPDNSPQARRLLIHGRVQGVAYRASAATEARRLGLDGWVRNRPDGTVEALVSGAAAAVASFIAWARRGPPQARVSRVEEFPADPPAPGFPILPTG